MHFNQDYHRNDYNRFHSGETPEQHRNNIVDLQGSREQRGSAFELYRKPIHHNMRLVFFLIYIYLLLTVI